MEFRILDLFCGAGGFSCGFEQVNGFKTVIGVDFDKKVLVTFKNNITNAKVICGNLKDEKLKKQIIHEAKMLSVNMIIGGPPCQGFSNKGKNLGLEDERNFLFLEYIKIVEALNPEVFVIENVKNLITSCDGYFIKQILDKLQNLGYIINYGVLNAINFGVPQNRERAIIIGSRNKNIQLPKEVIRKTTVRDAISDLAYLNSGEGEFVSDYKYEYKSLYQKQLRLNSNKLYNHIATNHSKIALEKLSFIPPEGDKNYLPKELHGKQRFSTTWSRLVWDSQSPTIDTRFDTPSNGRNSHPFLNRAITAREAARIQSFPDTFIFYGNKCSICKQIGNAVPPLMAKSIAENIKNAYNEVLNKGNNYEIFLADSKVLVKELIAKGIKVDSIITDPPYNISKNNNFNTLKSPRKGIDFGKWDKTFNLYDWIPEYVRLLKSNGSIIIFCSYLYISYLCDELKKSGIEVKDVLVWRKTNPMPRNINRRYVQDMEFAIWGVVRNGKWIFNKGDKSYLRSFFETSIVSGKEKTIHPTQKSTKLMTEIIKIHTNKNDLILDPFMGSGTTGVTALKENRKFIGIEINKDYYQIANNRIKEIAEHKNLNNK